MNGLRDMLCLIYLKQEKRKENFTVLLLPLAAVVTTAVRPEPKYTPVLQTLKKTLTGSQCVLLCERAQLCLLTK